jgi:hypothetical protein
MLIKPFSLLIGYLDQVQPPKQKVMARIFHYIGDFLILSGIKFYRLADQKTYSPGFRPG